MDQGLDQAVARGSEHLKQGKLPDAQEAFRKALEIEPGNPKVLALLGLAYFRASDFEHARPIYEDLVERLPTDASHRLNLGLVYLKLGDADRAISALEASRRLDPSQGRAISYLGLAYARAGRYAEAYRSFLIAGQNELAIEIEQNLTQAERDGIHGQLGRTPQGPLPAADPEPPAIAIARTVSSEPRTKPPVAPPGARTVSQELVAKAEAATLAAVAPTQPIQAVAPTQPIETVKPRTRTPHPLESSPEITILTEPTKPAAADPLTDSMQFVLPTAPAGAAPLKLDGRSMVSQAVADASATSTTATRTRSGGFAPRPLSELATESLVRADDGDDPFELSGGALVIRVSDKVLTRLDGVHVSGGDLQFDVATRRSRGHNTNERFDFGGFPLHVVSGKGYLIAVPNGRVFDAVALDDDILYLREDLIFAFESTLRWESGNVPGLRGKLPVVQFRGDGVVALRLERPLVRVKLPSSGVVLVDHQRLAGWIGRVIPRAVVPPEGGPMGEICVECTGEGVILVEPAADPTKPSFPRPAPPPPPVPPPAPEPVEPVMSVESALRDALGPDVF
ncbi:MAG: tetratricopeptide repeat protein [Proteobacteria bacterium]|nr:tetratricopeptide repeat protein [Pseudomonadota bacterium]